MRSRLLVGLVSLCASSAMALELTVQQTDGKPAALVMATLVPQEAAPVDRSDNGYATPGQIQPGDRWRTAFSDARGTIRFDLPTGQTNYRVRLRKPGYTDISVENLMAADQRTIVVHAETDAQLLAAAKPSNVWAAEIHFGTPAQDQQFRLQCSFCHQQGTAFIRTERSPEQWRETIRRMIGYGARLPTALQAIAPEKLQSGYAALREHPERLAAPLEWQDTLAQTRVDEWPIGDAMSQIHDMLLAENGMVYVGDNIQDRLYEVDPKSGHYTVYKLPRDPGDTLGGLIAARLAKFPKHESFLALHSLAASAKDGHIFMTPSVQRRIVEFDPATKQFKVHHLKDGLYPHTIRIDAQDRVWFTLSLSNQVGMIDRATGEQHFIDLPTRSVGEAITIRLVPLLFKLASLGMPLAALPIDERSSGAPLPYGIEVAPDGVVWIARLHANDLIRIDPVTLVATRIDFPALGPRRLRADAAGNLWITAFAESAIYRYDVKRGAYDRYDMPTLPKGTDTPYSLNVDRARGIVWVTGTASDTLDALEISTGKWSVVPLPHRMTFTRDIEIARDGSVYSANGAFPSWQIEGAQPTLIRVTPPWAQGAP